MKCENGHYSLLGQGQFFLSLALTCKSDWEMKTLCFSSAPFEVISYGLGTSRVIKEMVVLALVSCFLMYEVTFTNLKAPRPHSNSVR